TVPMLSSRQARRMRTAISPRFAIRIFRNIASCGSDGHRPAPAPFRPSGAFHALSQRDVSVFLLGIDVTLRFEGAQGGDDLRAGLGGLDDSVDIAAFGGDVGVRKALAELGNLCLAQELALRLRRALELAAVNNVDRAFRSHHRDFSSGPGV